MKTIKKANKKDSGDKTASKTTTSKKSEETKTNSLPIVGIGASAGGLEALEEFFENMPENNEMAFVVIQHLDPTRVGIMPELLQRTTEMKVLQATDRLKVKANHVYVIPPNKSMSLLNGALFLFDPVETRGLRLPIDLFFRSLADDQQQNSIGIILSGMGSDGSLGIKAIKEKNGLVMIQEPKTAKFNSMPLSAIENVVPDIIAPANELPTKLMAYLNFLPTNIVDTEIKSRNISNLDKIIILLREYTGHDFSMYKKSTLFRRIERRKGIHQIEKIGNYVKFLQENPEEGNILFKEFLIGVTSFFRDTAVWEMLKEKVLPDLINELPKGYVLRTWVPACSTGEEAYSLAIIFKETLEKIGENKNLSMQIFATDLDNDAIEKARRGVFSKNIEADVSQDRIKRFFVAEADGYRLNSSIREMVVFANQNVIKDPPFTKLDILSCRNMLIYMETQLQEKLIALFNYSLNQDGILLLGTAETPGNQRQGFHEIDAKLKIYKRTSTILPSELIDFPSTYYHKKTKMPETKSPQKAIENIQTLTDQILLQHFSPASVLVNDKGDILYITGRTGKYIEPSAGKANWNIHAMAREGLRQALPGAFRKAKQSYESVVIRNIKIGADGESLFVDITLKRIEDPESMRGHIIIVFNDAQTGIDFDKVDPKSKKRPSSVRQKELEIELQRSFEELQSSREEMQTSQEELKSTNEELQSTNEELQSTNEELTTSKEEMQSLNEELQTVNIELQTKISEYMRASDDMKNLLNSIEIAALFLDKELNIRRFTDRVTQIFKLREADIGRPFTDLVTDLLYPKMGVDARSVIKSLTTIEKAIPTTDGRWFNVRIMPYRTIDDRIDGLVMTFTDITLSKKLEIDLKEANEALRKKKG